MDKQQQGAANREWGKIAEGLARDYLYSEGYVIRETGWSSGPGIEIDIVAQKDKTIVFVEVKARSGEWGDPLDAVDMKKRRKMVKGADKYMENFPFPYEYRFDIITYTGNEQNHVREHIEDAFLPGVNGEIR